MNNNINRKQFLGSLLAGATMCCISAQVGSKLDKSKPTEFEKCRNDILYFVDNYLEVNDPLYGKLKMSSQQREYLKRISTTPDYFFCAKGRQIGISTANNVFAYWKSIFFGPDHHVFIVEPDERTNKRMWEMYLNVSNSGFMPLPNRVHFITPRTMMAHDLADRNSTFILDEFDFWDNHCLDGLSKKQLNRFLMNPLWAKELSLEEFEKFKSHMIVVSSYCSPYDYFAMLMSSVDDSRRLVLPSPISGLEA